MSDQPSAASIRRALDCGRPGCACSRGQNTHCPGPSHRNGDQNPSLGVTDSNGKTLVTCYGGCDQDAVIAALQERGVWPIRGEREQRQQRGPTRIVATYEYRDATGALNFEVVRLEPKDFRQRRRSKSGGWEWKAGDRSLIYRLPELLAASDDAIVFVPEGEKDTDALAALGLVATTNAGGAGKWSDANSRWLDGRRVVILPDNDEAGRLDAERKLASLRPRAARVAVLNLPNLRDKGDVSDWLADGGTAERLTAQAEAALATAPERAAPSEKPRAAPLPAFPVHVLPPSMRGLIESGSRAMAVPSEFIALPMLVLAGAVIGNAWEVELKGGWREGPNLYAAIVGDPGAKKTPSLKLALRGVHAIQSRLASEYRADKAAFDEEYALWEKAPKASRGEPPRPPKFKHLWTSDSTTEALAEMLSEAKGLVLFRDELVGWVKSMDAYRSGGKGADRQHYLSMWSRSPIKIDRKSRPDPIVVDRPCLSVVGGIQPDVLPDLIDNAKRDDGFIDRLLFAYPDLGVDRWTDGGVDEDVQAAAEQTFAALYALDGATMPSGDVLPRVARFESEALALWQEWYDETATEIREDALPASLKGVWAKLPSQLARLALILHVTWAADAGQQPKATIPAATLAAGVAMADYFKAHARTVMGEVRLPRQRLEDRIVRGLAQRGASTTRAVHLEILGSAFKYDRVKGTLETLLEDGRVSVADVKQRGGSARLWSAVEQESERRSEGRRTS